MKSKKIIKILLLSSILIASLLVLSGRVEAATYTADQLRSKFNEIRNMQGYRAGDYYKWNDGGWYSDYCSSGHAGWQCHGYGINLFDWLFGQCAMCSGRIYDMNQVRVGDLIRYNNDPWGEHTIIVQDVVGDTVYFTDANGDGAGHVRWDQSTTKSYLQSKLVYIARASGNDVKTLSDSEKPKIVESGVDMSSITSTSFKVRVKATDNVGVKEVGLNIWAPNQERVWRLATYNSNTGYWEYTIKKSNFGNASGLYDFDTYVFDAAGNSTSKAYSAFPMGSTVVKNLGDFTARIALKANTNYVMGTTGTTNLSNVVLSTKSLSDNSQLWKFTKNSDNTYTITHVKSGRAIDIDNYSNENGTRVQIYTKANVQPGSTHGTNQRFYIMSYNGGYRIVPQCSNDVKAIDNTSAKVTNGNKIELYEACSNNNNAQTWIFQKVATNISVTPTSATLKVGETKTLSKTLSPSGIATTTVKWTSSNSSVATVNASTGLVTAKKAGTATITATTTDGTNLTANCRITVKLPFTDVNTSDWYYDAVNYAYSNKIVSGTTTTTFSPNDKLTRAMLVTILYNMEGRPSVSGTSKFLDVKNSNEWYYTAIVWASKNRIVSGYPNGNFGPNDPITREQLAVMLNQYCQYKGKYKAQANILNRFSDANKISSFAKWGMQWATGTGVITGSNGKLNPQGNATRAEAISMIYKYNLNIK